MHLSHSQLVFSYVVHELVPTEDQCFPEEWRSPSAHNVDDQLHPQELQGKTIHLDPQEDCYNLVTHEQFIVKAFRLFHRIPSFGFVIEERERPGKLQTQKLKDMGNFILPHVHIVHLYFLMYHLQIQLTDQSVLAI